MYPQSQVVETMIYSEMHVHRTETFRDARQRNSTSAKLPIHNEAAIPQLQKGSTDSSCSALVHHQTNADNLVLKLGSASQINHCIAEKVIIVLS